MNHVLLYTADGGNLDCIHPVQLVLDCFGKEDHRDHYAQQLESWFRNYHSMRNLKFMGLDECVAGSVFISVEIEMDHVCLIAIKITVSVYYMFLVLQLMFR